MRKICVFSIVFPPKYDKSQKPVLTNQISEIVFNTVKAGRYFDLFFYVRFYKGISRSNNKTIFKT